jgi:hypothetical protein
MGVVVRYPRYDLAPRDHRNQQKPQRVARPSSPISGLRRMPNFPQKVLEIAARISHSAGRCAPRLPLTIEWKIGPARRFGLRFGAVGRSMRSCDDCPGWRSIIMPLTARCERLLLGARNFCSQVEMREANARGDLRLRAVGMTYPARSRRSSSSMRSMR